MFFFFLPLSGFICQVGHFEPVLCLFTHDEARRADAGAADAVAVGSVGAAARLLAAVAVVTSGAGLVAVKPRPPGGAGALPRQRVAAGGATGKRLLDQGWTKFSH